MAFGQLLIGCAVIMHVFHHFVALVHTRAHALVHVLHHGLPRRLIVMIRALTHHLFMHGMAFGHGWH